MLGIIQKKGNPERLSGRLIVYAKIMSTGYGDNHLPFAGMVRNGLLVVEGEFQSGDSFKKFFQKEFGGASSEDFSEILDRLREAGGELPEGVDPDTVRERLEEVSNMEVIPVPAKVVFYENENEILMENADIYYIGEFYGLSQAHLCITSLPIFYQAQYREQINLEEQKYINDVLSQIEDGGITEISQLQETGVFLAGKGNLDTFVGNLQELLTTQVIPFLLYETEDEESYENRIRRFYEFMKPYPQQDDIRKTDLTIRDLRRNFKNAKALRRLELLSQKIGAIYHENFERVPALQKELDLLDSDNSSEDGQV